MFFFILILFSFVFPSSALFCPPPSLSDNGHALCTMHHAPCTFHTILHIIFFFVFPSFRTSCSFYLFLLFKCNSGHLTFFNKNDYSSDSKRLEGKHICQVFNSLSLFVLLSKQPTKNRIITCAFEFKR